MEAVPPYLAERSRKLNAASPGPWQRSGTYVMDAALRTRENPALDTAITLADKFNTPIAVLLEAMREVSQAFAGLEMGQLSKPVDQADDQAATFSPSLKPIPAITSPIS
jgi:hypothetical protein